MAVSSITNEDTGEVLGKVAAFTANSGASSPFPATDVAPVPSVSATIAGDRLHEITYMSGDSTTVRSDEDIFQGHLNSNQVAEASGVSSITVDHITSALNQDIRTLPVFSTGHDKGLGSGILSGAISHWAGECGLFVNGVRGNVLLGINNDAPGIGYYRHPTMRYLGVEYEAGNDYIQWVPTETSTVDAGISLDVGEKLRFVIGFIAEGSSLVLPNVGGRISFAATVLGEVIAEDVTTYKAPTISWNFNTSTGNFTVRESTTTAGAPDKVAINYTAATTRKDPDFVELTITRTAAKTLKYDCRMVFSTALTDSETSATGTVTNSYIPTRLSATDIVLDAKVKYAYRRWFGTQSFYITKDGVPNTATFWKERGFQSEMVSDELKTADYTVVPGMSGNAWQMMNDLAAVYGTMFLPLEGNMLLPGEVGGLLASFYQPTLSGVVLSSQTREMAETVEVVNYDYTYSKDSFSPIQLLVSDTAYSVGLGERQEHTVQTDSTFTLLEQPRCVTVPTAIKAHRDSSIGDSLYSVYDSDNLEVDPNTWNDGGGFISVESTENPGEMKLVIQAPNNPLASRKPPFIISIESTIPSLIISGLGAKSDKKTITSYTGAGDGINVKKLGTTFDSPLVARESQAMEVAVLLGSVYGTPPTALTCNRRYVGFSGFLDMAVRYREAMYIATQWSSSPANTHISSSVRFTPMSLFDADYANMTCGQYNSLFAGKTIKYANISPLKK